MIFQEKLMQQGLPIISKTFSATLPGTADPKSFEKLWISTWTIQAFSFTKVFDLPVLTQLSFPKQPVSIQKVRNKFYFFKMDLIYKVEINSFSLEKDLYCHLHNGKSSKFLCQKSVKNAATNLEENRTSPLVGYIVGEGSYSAADFSWIMYKLLRETELRAQRAQA